MEWENKVNKCLFGSQRAWISAVISLIPLLIFVGYFVGFGFLLPIFITSTILILSITLFTLSKPNKLAPNSPTIPGKEIPFQNSEQKQHDHEIKTTQEQKQAQEEEEEEEVMMSSSPDSQGSMSEESEWLSFSDDGSISDEESLIEIALPSGHVDDHKTKMAADLFPRQCMFKQRSLMELLAEINEIIIEEDNLIEIDISIGSIKCSRFEIEA